MNGDPAGKDKQTQAAEENDAGFNDPFFEDPETVIKQQAEKARAAKRATKAASKAAELDNNDEGKRALEAILDSHVADAPVEKHFDMKEIVRNEKIASKGTKIAGRSKKRAAEAKDRHAKATAAVLQDDFKPDTSDPRFAALFDSHDFAIDPTNPRFQPTKTMNVFLEERRNKRKASGDAADRGAADGAAGAGSSKSEAGAKDKKRKKDSDAGANQEDLSRLVDRIKAKAK